jgi:hypothetical protein
MIRNSKSQNSINFLSGVNDSPIKFTDEEIRNIEKQTNKTAEDQKSKKLDGHDDINKQTHSILSSRGAGDTQEIKGSSKYIKCETSNSVFGPGKFKENKRDEEDPNDKINAVLTAEKIAEQKRQSDAERMKTLPKKGSAAVFSSDKEGYSFKNPINNIGLFTDNTFVNLPDKTEGEQLTDKIKKQEAEIDESWKNSNGAFSSKKLVNTLFDKLSNNKDI